MPQKTKRISTKKEVHMNSESFRGSPSRPNFAHWWNRESLIHMDHPKPTSHDLFGPVDFRGVIAPPTKSSSTCVNVYIIDPQGTKSPYVLPKLCVDSFGFLAKHLQVFFSSLQVSKHLHNQTYAGFRDDMELGMIGWCLFCAAKKRRDKLKIVSTVWTWNPFLRFRTPTFFKAVWYDPSFVVAIRQHAVSA